MAKKKWNGVCSAGTHGLDFEDQPCNLCHNPKPSTGLSDYQNGGVFALTMLKGLLDARREKIRVMENENTFGRGVAGMGTILNGVDAILSAIVIEFETKLVTELVGK